MVISAANVEWAHDTNGDCIECPLIARCNCSPDETCSIVPRSCWSCPQILCSSPSSPIQGNFTVDPADEAAYLKWLVRTSQTQGKSFGFGLFKRAQETDNCGGDLVNCDPNPAACPACPKGQACVQMQRQCGKCAENICMPSNSGGGGVNPGVIAGPVVAGVLLLIASMVLFWWLRRKKARDLARLEDLAERARKGESSAFHLAQGKTPQRSRHTSQSPRSPTSSGNQRASQNNALASLEADAEYRDEKGATIRVYKGKRGIINADPNHPDNGGVGGMDPFQDGGSVSTSGGSGHSGNVIPIHFVPGSTSDDSLARGPPSAAQQAAAGRALELARQNLHMHRMGPQPPPRPARSPDLDLRLKPTHQPLSALSEASNRSSFMSEFSAAPSFMSSQTADLHDVPMIVTSRQVHVGRLQAAEVVRLGENNYGPAGDRSGNDAGSDESAGSGASNPFSEKHGVHAPQYADMPGDHGESIHSSSPSAPSPTDLRFSMGSLACDRASISSATTTGTAQGAQVINLHHPPVPVPVYHRSDRPRLESVSSYRSAGGDLFLGNFPMIAPGSAAHPVPQGGQAVPTNMSTATLDLPLTTGPPPLNKPPVAFRGASARPLTSASSHSLADSFLGTFPFLPPDVPPADAATDPANTSSRGASTKPGRLTLGMSSASEGLGDFDFSFDDHHEPQGEDPATPRAPTTTR